MGKAQHMQSQPYQLSVRSNEIIQNSRYLLSAWAENILTYIIARIDIFAENFTEIEFYLQDFFRDCGIKSDGSYNYKTFKEGLVMLQSNVITINVINKRGNQAERLVHWLRDAETEVGTGRVTVLVHEDMAPYLLNQKKNFTTIENIYFLRLGKVHDKRLYLYCKSRQFKKLESYQFTIPITKLKQAMGEGTLSEKGVFIVDTSNDWGKFRERRLDPAIQRINENTDIDISYIPIKSGRKVVEVEITVTTKDIARRLEVHQRLRLGDIPDPDEILLPEDPVPVNADM